MPDFEDVDISSDSPSSKSIILLLVGLCNGSLSILITCLHTKKHFFTFLFFPYCAIGIFCDILCIMEQAIGEMVWLLQTS